MNENTFKIDYELTAQDYIDFNLFHLTYSKSMKKLMFIQRYIIPVFYFALPFFLDDSTNISFWYWMVFSVSMYIIWVWTSPNRMKRNITKKVMKSLKNQNFAKLLGEHNIIINKDGIADSGKGGEAKASWGSIVDIAESKNQIYIFISESKAFIIPNRAFAKEELRQQFIAQIKEFKALNAK